MKLTYLFHSGFLVESGCFSVILDYYRAGEACIDRALHRGVPLYVLVSHEHHDHYNPEILSWENPGSTIFYVFPREMASRPELAALSNAVFLDRGDCFDDGRLQIQAFGSTDMGVSYCLVAEEKSVFHAGDLNNWHWRDESTEAEVRAAEMAYRRELDYMVGRVTRIDVAMFPVDARQGSGYMRGAEQFVETFEVDTFVPMHFYPAVREAEAFAPIAHRYGAKFVLLSRTGDSVMI